MGCNMATVDELPILEMKTWDALGKRDEKNGTVRVDTINVPYQTVLLMRYFELNYDLELIKNCH